MVRRLPQNLMLSIIKEKLLAPVIPSVFAAYKKGDWTISGFFAITGGGGKASFDDGLPMFESLAMAGIFKATAGAGNPVSPNMMNINSAMDGKQYIYSVQLGLSYKINVGFRIWWWTYELFYGWL